MNLEETGKALGRIPSGLFILTVHHNKYSKSPTRNSSLARIISINTSVVD